MTVRRSARVSTTPQSVAAELGEQARFMLPREPVLHPGTGISIPGAEAAYEEFFDQLTGLVRSRVMHASRGFVLDVARLAGVSPADWYREAIREADDYRGEASSNPRARRAARARRGG